MAGVFFTRLAGGCGRCGCGVTWPVLTLGTLGGNCRRPRCSMASSTPATFSLTAGSPECSKSSRTATLGRALVTTATASVACRLASPTTLARAPCVLPLHPLARLLLCESLACKSVVWDGCVVTLCGCVVGCGRGYDRSRQSLLCRWTLELMATCCIERDGVFLDSQPRF